MDLRIEKTYRALLSAFTQLLETHRYEDITVAMLCETAMIRRTTFYKHFADKSAFFSFFVDSLRNELLKHSEQRTDLERMRNAIEHADMRPAAMSKQPIALETVPDERSVAILQGLVEFMLEHEHLVDNILESSMSGMMMLMMVDKVAETIRDRYREAFQERWKNDEALEAAAEFAAGGIVRLLEKWWTTGHSKEGEGELIVMATTMVVRVLAL